MGPWIRDCGPWVREICLNRQGLGGDLRNLGYRKYFIKHTTQRAAAGTVTKVQAVAHIFPLGVTWVLWSCSPVFEGYKMGWEHGGKTRGRRRIHKNILFEDA